MKYMTPQWYMMCQELHPSAKNERSIREAMEAYRREYVKNFGRKEPDFGNAHLHDSIVLSQRQEGGDLVMELEPDMTDITRLVFKDCRVLHLDVFIGRKKPGSAAKRAAILRESEPLKDAWWLYDEIYPTDGGYEIHILLDKGSFRLIEFTIQASEIELYRDESVGKKDFFSPTASRAARPSSDS